MGMQELQRRKRGETIYHPYNPFTILRKISNWYTGTPEINVEDLTNIDAEARSIMVKQILEDLSQSIKPRTTSNSTRDQDTKQAADDRAIFVIG
jgi:hypothetical protein